MAHPSQADLAHFERFVREFEREGFTAGVTHPAEEIEAHRYTWPSWTPSTVVVEWHDALYERGIVDPEADYLSDEFGQRIEAWVKDPSSLLGAGLDTIRAVLTYIVRGERFCEGHIAEMFERGVAQAATSRLACLGQSSPQDICAS